MNQKREKKGRERKKAVFFIRSATHGSQRVTARDGTRGTFLYRVLDKSATILGTEARMKERLARGSASLPTETRLMIGKIGTHPLLPRIASFFSPPPRLVI